MIAEIDRRRLFLDYGYRSMFVFLTEGVNYSPTAALRRLDAARLSRQVEGVTEKLRAGELNLSTTSIISQAVRSKEKIARQGVNSHKLEEIEGGQATLRSHEDPKVGAETKSELVELVRNKNIKEVQVLVAQKLDLPVLKYEKQTPQKDGSIKLELVLTKEQQEVFAKARELLSHKNPNPTWAELFEETAKFLVSKRDLSQKSSPKKQAPNRTSAADGTQSKKLIFARYIPSSTRRIVFQRDQCCQWREKNKICGSKYQLQIDHIQPVWAGGDNSQDNLQLLCRAHNNFKYKKEVQIRLL